MSTEDYQFLVRSFDPISRIFGYLRRQSDAHHAPDFRYMTFDLNIWPCANVINVDPQQAFFGERRFYGSGFGQLDDFKSGRLHLGENVLFLMSAHNRGPKPVLQFAFEARAFEIVSLAVDRFYHRLPVVSFLVLS